MDKQTRYGLAAFLVCVAALFGTISYGSGAMGIGGAISSLYGPVTVLGDGTINGVQLSGGVQAGAVNFNPSGQFYGIRAFGGTDFLFQSNGGTLASINFGTGVLTDSFGFSGGSSTFAGVTSTNGIAASTGIIQSRNATGGFSFGSAGTEFFGMAAGTSSILLSSTATLSQNVTAGSAGVGTGLTASASGMVRHWVDKMTVDKTALTANPSTDVTIWTTGANTRLVRLTADVTQTFTGGALSAMTVQCGSAAGGNQYLLAGSVLTATTTLGDVVAEMGAGLVSATLADFGTPSAGIPAAIAISCRFTCTGANCNAATTGSVTFQIEGVTYP